MYSVASRESSSRNVKRAGEAVANVFAIVSGVSEAISSLTKTLCRMLQIDVLLMMLVKGAFLKVRVRQIFRMRVLPGQVTNQPQRILWGGWMRLPHYIHHVYRQILESSP